MQVIKMHATRREAAGKGGTRRVRKEGKIPAVAYGKHLPAVPLAVAPGELNQVLTSERGRNTVIELEVEGSDKLTVLICDYQYHPVTREYLHADFFQIHMDKEVDIDVPLELTGKAQGVVLGGTLRQVFRKLPLRCLPANIPVKITFDVTNLGLDVTVPVRELPLPEGVSARLPPEQTVVAIVKEKQAAEEEPQAGAPAAGPKASVAPKADAAEKK